MTKPYLFLDVDGVINALSHNTQADPAFDQIDVTIPWNGTFPIVMRHRVKRWLCEELPELADVRWNTTWEHHANDCLCPAFGIPELIVAGRNKHFSESQHTWKLAGVVETYREDPRPFVWIDDVVCSRVAEQTLLYEETGIDHDFILVRPNSYSGITDEQIEAVNGFLEAQA